MSAEIRRKAELLGRIRDLSDNIQVLAKMKRERDEAVGLLREISEDILLSDEESKGDLWFATDWLPRVKKLLEDRES